MTSAGMFEAALRKIRSRSFSERHPELGKMINCVCGHRHRQNERKCEQKFTYRVGDYELFRKDEDGKLVPDYRTAIRPDEKPTLKQIMGRAAFDKKRFHPHPSKTKLQIIERTRKVFLQKEFPLDGDAGQLKKNLDVARKIAIRQIRREHAKEIRTRQGISRHINRVER